VEESRATNLERLRSERFDLLVSGGIIGAGVAELGARHGLAPIRERVEELLGP
jgi:glycerol-3-phosphate dehydrogenase